MNFKRTTKKILLENPFFSLKSIFFVLLVFSIFISLAIKVNAEIEIKLNSGYEDSEYILIKNNNTNELVYQEVNSEKTQNNQQNNQIIYQHDFEVNLYNSTNQYNNPNNNQNNINDLSKEIKIIPIKTEAEINQCESANFSFQISNPSNNRVIYDFKVKNFNGAVYLTQNLLLGNYETKIVNFKLVPDCKIFGNFNPFVYVETKKEEAVIPLLIRIKETEKQETIDENNCKYYYDEAICNSALYVKFKKNSVYKIDLSKWFYDPDQNKLKFSSNYIDNMDVTIKGNIAYIKPSKNWYGTREIVFTAEDEYGAKSTRVFYVHVLNQEKNFWEIILNFFNNF
ncbi:MAG: hypothetical protein QXM96_02385 [Candidatus Woesearchaeota archaeon]